MKNYEEKEKKLEDVLNKLNTLSSKVVKMNEHIDSLNLEKNQLLSEKEESEENYRSLSTQHQQLKKELEKINKDVNKNFAKLSKQHQELKSELEKIDKDVSNKFGNKNNFNKKIDELNQETEILIDEIEKWQT